LPRLLTAMAARLAAFAAVFLAQSKAFDFGDVETQPSVRARAFS